MSQGPTLPSSLEDIPRVLQVWWNNLTRQTEAAFTRLTPQDAIRLVVIACAYALIVRPMILRLGAKVQAQHHEKEARENAAAGLDANDLRGKVAIPGVDSDSEEEEDGVKGDVTSGEWGRRARLRQRKVVRKALEVRERAGEEEDLEDIKDLLEG